MALLECRGDDAGDSGRAFSDELCDLGVLAPRSGERHTLDVERRAQETARFVFSARFSFSRWATNSSSSASPVK